LTQVTHPPAQQSTAPPPPVAQQPTVPPPAHPPIEALAVDQPTADGFFAGWRPTEQTRQKCEEVVQDLKGAREAIETLRRAEINIMQVIDEQATERRLTSIVERVAANTANTTAITELLNRPGSCIDHKTFEEMLDRVIRQSPAAQEAIGQQRVTREDMLDRGRQGINDRAVSMVSDVMADFLKNERQRPQQVAAVMETLVDEAHRTGMTTNQFNAVIQRQFRAAAQGASDEQAGRLTQAQPTITARARDRFTELGTDNNRRQGLRNLEGALNKQVPTAGHARGRR
jgi:hypothetical protein